MGRRVVTIIYLNDTLKGGPMMHTHRFYIYSILPLYVIFPWYDIYDEGKGNWVVFAILDTYGWHRTACVKCKYSDETYVAHRVWIEELMLMVYWRAGKNRGLSMRISIDRYSYASCVCIQKRNTQEDISCDETKNNIRHKN